MGEVCRAEAQYRDIEDPNDPEAPKVPKWVDEATCLYQVVLNKTSAAANLDGGVWLGGNQYKITQAMQIELEDKKFEIINGSRKEGGFGVVYTEPTFFPAPV